MPWPRFRTLLTGLSSSSRWQSFLAQREREKPAGVNLMEMSAEQQRAALAPILAGR